MTMTILDCDQRSQTWFAARTGIVTCSNLEHVFAKGKGKGRMTYVYKIVAERLLNTPTQGGFTDAMARGITQEEDARAVYEIETWSNVTSVGFCLDEDLALGYSPDGFVGNDGLVEFKTKAPHLQVEVLNNGEVPDEHVAQLQGGLLVTGRAWIDFVSYCPGLPLFVKRVYPDAKYHDAIRTELADFYATVNSILYKITNQQETL